MGGLEAQSGPRIEAKQKMPQVTSCWEPPQVQIVGNVNKTNRGKVAGLNVNPCLEDHQIDHHLERPKDELSRDVDDLCGTATGAPQVHLVRRQLCGEVGLALLGRGESNQA